MASISGPKCSDLQSISPKFSRLRRAENPRATRAGQLDYPPSIEHPRHFPRGRRYPGERNLSFMEMCGNVNEYDMHFDNNRTTKLHETWGGVLAGCSLFGLRSQTVKRVTSGGSAGTSIPATTYSYQVADLVRSSPLRVSGRAPSRGYPRVGSIAWDTRAIPQTKV